MFLPLLPLLPLLLLVACSPKPTSVVERYLKAVQAGNLAEQNKIMCNAVPAGDKPPIQSAPAWTIVGEESRTTPVKAINPAFHYQAVTVKIGESTFVVDVWKTNDVYLEHKNAVDEIKRLGEFNDPAYDRSKWSAEESCVLVEEKP